jgi:hypothetical protein
MKGHRFLPILLILGMFGLSACGLNVVRGSGNVVSESRQVSNFDSIAFSGSGDVIITQGDAEGIKIEAEDNLIPYIRTEVRGKTLHIYFDPRDLVMVHANKVMRFHVSMKQVVGLDLSGSGTIYSESVTTDNLDINISGSGETTIDNLKADRLAIDISGSGKCKLTGGVTTEKLVISGSGNCNSSALSSKDVTINVSGSGKAMVMAADNLDVSISGSGDVLYSGHPQISQKITGSGKISAK